MGKSVDIDWSGFDINNYPKVDPYKLVFRIGGQTSGYGGFSHIGQGGFGGITLNTNTKYQWIIVSFLYFIMSISAFLTEKYLIGMVCVLSGVIYIILLPVIKKRGNKIYEKICMEQYKSEYIKKIEFENYINVRQIAIMEYYMKGKKDISSDVFAQKEKTNLELVNEKKIDKLEMNQASHWYKEQEYDLGDVILLNRDAFFSENKKAVECGLPKDYYVIAVKDTYWLCCHAEEECVYAFSKTLGLTHTKYQSLYDYIIDVCDIPFNTENDD